MTAPICAECGATTRLTNGAEIYPHRPDLAQRAFWRCACGAYCGCHKGTDRPLGTPAGPTLRRERLMLHAQFDKLWKGSPARSARGEAYAWLGRELELTPPECHIGLFDAALCARAFRALRLRLYSPAE
jgi:hypothetical protein